MALKKIVTPPFEGRGSVGKSQIVISVYMNMNILVKSHVDNFSTKLFYKIKDYLQ